MSHARQDARTSLYIPERWDWAQVDVYYTSSLPADEIVQSVHVVGFLEDRPDHVVVCREETPPWFIPGGTREPGEPVIKCLERELKEEAGGVLTSEPLWLGTHVGRGYLDRPYRAHLPHPVKAWLWAAASVRIVGPPQVPADAEDHVEHVAEVRAAPFDEACELLAENAEWYPELLCIAYNEMRDAAK